MAVSAATLTPTSETQTAPWSPHTLTCTVWPPLAADTLTSRIWAFTVVVSGLLSSEYPMALTGCEEQVAALAESLNGEDTSAPLAGLLMTIPPMAGMDPITSRAGKTEGLGAFEDDLHFLKIGLRGLRIAVLLELRRSGRSRTGLK